MASTFCQKLILLSLFMFLSVVSAKPIPKAKNQRSSSSLVKLQGEKLIRGLNLFPKHAINNGITIDDLTVDDSKIVEKKVKFPVTVSGGGAGPSVQEFGQYAGYYKLPHTKAASMFYFFFESRNNKSDPVVIWLTGGPGCSGELALFYENGPVKFGKNLSLVWNDFGWDKASNILFVDQPTGTGFSYSPDESDIRHNETGVSNDLYDFLQEFFKQHPEYVANDFYITGESYAGHYIPALAVRVNEGNKAKEGIHVNLKGFAIGNGLTDPGIQYQAYPDFALNMSLIQQSDYDSIKQDLVPPCLKAIKSCSEGGVDCAQASSTCNDIFNEILNIAGNINYYDIRKQCESGGLCYDFSAVETFLNLKSVRDALGVGNIEFVSCSTQVYDAMVTDWMKNFEVGIPALLEDGIKVLIYAGEYDLICNWLGNSNWVHAMPWSGQKQFDAAPTVSFVVDGDEAGQLKSHGPLAFLKVHNAGHMVPMDQPKAALQMIQNWMQGKLPSSEISE